MISGISCSNSRCTKLRAGAAENHFHAAARLADLEHGGSHALVDVMRLAGDLLAAGQDRFDVGERHGAAPPS